MKSLIFVVLLFLIFFEFLIVFPKKLETGEDASLAAQVKASDTKGAEQRMDGVHFVESKDGKQDWELYADSAEGEQGHGLWKLKKVKVLFFSMGQVEFTVHGDNGAIDAKTKDLHIKGNIIINSRNGYQLTTEFVKYQAKIRQIDSPNNIHLVGPKDSFGDSLIVDGVGLVAQVEKSLILLNKDIHAKKLIRDKKPFSLESERGEFSGKSRIAKFYGQVKLQYDDLTVFGDESFFQYGERMDLFDSVKVNGAVRVLQANRVATAKALNMDLLTNKFVFAGKPKLVQEGDELTGEEIVFYDGGKRVKVENVSSQEEKSGQVPVPKAGAEK